MPQAYSFMVLTPRFDRGTVYTIILFFVLSIFLFYFIVRFAQKIVAFLKLDKHFDSDDIDMSRITKADLLQFGIIVIGGLLFINTFIDLQHQIVLYYQSKMLGILDKTSKIRLALPVLNMLIGYLLLTNSIMI